MAKRKKIIPQKKSLLFIGEGADEEAFFCHLKSIYPTGNTFIRTGNAFGGHPARVVEKIRKMKRSGDYKECLGLLDSDRAEDFRLAVEDAQRCGIRLIVSDPCLEAELLRILSVKFKQGQAPCKLKSIVQQHLSGSGSSAASYQKSFTKKVLDNGRKESPWLNELVRYSGSN